MRQASKQTVGIFAGVVFVIACVLMAASGGSAFETLAANGTLTPWVYLPFIGKQGASTPTPTGTPATPTATGTPTSAPPASTSWYGIVRAPVEDWPTIRENLGGAVVDLVVRPYTPLNDITASLDSAQALGYQVIFHIFDGDTDTNKPWYLDVDGQWIFPQHAVDILQAVSDHPAVFAIYALHEPLDGGVTYVGVEQQQALYSLLKLHAGGLPVYTDIGSLSAFEAQGEPLADGMCDYCATFPSYFRSDWTSEQCLAETLRRIDADMDTWQRLMPNSQVMFLVNTYAFTSSGVPRRLPTPYELGVVKGYLCDLDRPMLYIPWHHSSYDATLEDAPELWPVIAEGCGGQLGPSYTSTPPPPTPTPATSLTPTLTASPTPTPTILPPTHTPTPTPSPPADLEQVITIDHNSVNADAIPHHWLAQAQLLDIYFAHKSVGNNILDGMADLQAQDPGRYTIAVYSGGADWFVGNDGILHRSVGSNRYPQTKIDGFNSDIRSGGFHVADAAMMKFCPGDTPPFATMSAADTWVAYRDMMAGLEQDYPDVSFIWWTMPLATAADNRGNDEKAVFNALVRDYCASNGCPLFDIAVIESYDPDGNPIVSSTGHEAMWEGYSSDGAHLNETGRQRVASAIWWLLARIAGWDGL